jgi:hypothetical protein
LTPTMKAFFPRPAIPVLRCDSFMGTFQSTI